MATVGNSLIKGLDIAQTIHRLDGFYAFEMLGMHFNLAMHNRMEGQAAVVLAPIFVQKADESLAHAKGLAERVAQLGGVVTGDPTQFVALSPIERFSLPSSNSDIGVILGYVLEQVRLGIRAYGDFLEALAGKDAVTYFQVLELLRDYIQNEAEIEAVLMQSAVSDRIAA